MRIRIPTDKEALLTKVMTIEAAERNESPSCWVDSLRGLNNTKSSPTENESAIQNQGGPVETHLCKLDIWVGVINMYA